MQPILEPILQDLALGDETEATPKAFAVLASIPLWRGGQLQIQSGTDISALLEAQPAGATLRLALSVASSATLYRIDADVRGILAEYFAAQLTRQAPVNLFERLRFDGLVPAAAAALASLRRAGTTVDAGSLPSPNDGAAPFLAAWIGSLREAALDSTQRGLLEWGEWLLAPGAGYTAYDITYDLSDEDRAMYWCGLSRLTDIDGFAWLRSGHIILHEVSPSGTGITDAARATLRGLLAEEPGLSDYTDWQDRICAALPELRARLNPDGPIDPRDGPVASARNDLRYHRLKSLTIPESATETLDRVLSDYARDEDDVRALIRALTVCQGGKRIDLEGWGRFVMALADWRQASKHRGLASLPRYVSGHLRERPMWRVEERAVHPDAFAEALSEALFGTLADRTLDDGDRDLIHTLDHIAELAHRGRGPVPTLTRSTNTRQVLVELSDATFVADRITFTVRPLQGEEQRYGLDSSGRLHRHRPAGAIAPRIRAVVDEDGAIDARLVRVKPPQDTPIPRPGLDIGDPIVVRDGPQRFRGYVRGWSATGAIQIRPESSQRPLDVSADDVSLDPTRPRAPGSERSEALHRQLDVDAYLLQAD